MIAGTYGEHLGPPPAAGCVIVGPYYPVGDVDWRCITHQVDAVLRDPARYGGRDHRREEFRCPVGEPS